MRTLLYQNHETLNSETDCLFPILSVQIEIAQQLLKTSNQLLPIEKHCPKRLNNLLIYYIITLSFFTKY